MNAAALILVAAFGLVAGSFLAMASYRLPRGLSVVRPGSRCPECGHALSAWENVPLASFAVLRARCRGCGARIGWRYPLLEIAAAAAFVWSWLRGGGGWGFVASAFFLCSLAALAATDLETRQLPDEITLGAWAVGLALAWRADGGVPVAALAASFGGAGLLALVGVGYMRLRGREGLGWGDVKMVGMLGAFLGVEGAIAAVFLASVSAAAVGGVSALGVLLQRRRRGRSWRRARASTAVYLARAGLPLGVFLAAAGAVAWIVGPGLWRGWLGY